MKGAANMQERFLTDAELQDARGLIGWQFWAGPIIAAIFFFLAAWFVAGEKGIETKIIVLALLGTVAVGFWLVRFRQYRTFAADIQRRVVEVVKGAPERVRLTRTGRCYARIDGHNICVPNEHYKELQDANAAEIEFLPGSRLATRVKIIRGLGIGS